MNIDDQALDQAKDTPEADAESSQIDKEVTQGPTDEELFLAALNGEIPTGDDDFMLAPVKRGQIVKGTVAGKTDSEILVDIGVKSEGIITGREFEQLDRDAKESLKVGDDVWVYVLAAEGPSGHVQLSLRRAMEEQDWRDAEEYMKQATTYESKVAGYNKGGLIVRFGKLRGFVPASQISRERQTRSIGDTPEERWAQMVGEEIVVKVIEVDRGRNRLILSERAAAREWRAKRRAELLESLAVGQVHTGRVISLADFGAFVDLGGADGLIHLSELAWEHVSHPKEVLKVGDEVQVEIINIDQEHQRIGLSRKKCLDDPWDTVISTFKSGQLVQGIITKMTKFGAFARLVDHPEIEGLIHISELSDRRVGHPREVVEENQVLTLRIIRIDTERRRLGLSRRQVASEEYMDEDWHEVLGALADEAGEGAVAPAESSEVAEPETAAEQTPQDEAVVSETSTESGDQETAEQTPRDEATTLESSEVAEPETAAEQTPQDEVAS